MKRSSGNFQIRLLGQFATKIYFLLVGLSSSPAMKNNAIWSRVDMS